MDIQKGRVNVNVVVMEQQNPYSICGYTERERNHKCSRYGTTKPVGIWICRKRVIIIVVYGTKNPLRYMIIQKKRDIIIAVDTKPLDIWLYRKRELS